MIRSYIVFCPLGRHEWGQIESCKACQLRREYLAKYKPTEEQPEPLVDKTTPGLYRDEGFWQFHYWSTVEREKAKAEYNEYLEEQRIWAQIHAMPDVRGDE
jgi:hypothetical protein